MFKLKRHAGGPILKPNSSRPWETEGVFNPGIARIGDVIYMLYRAIGETEAYISRFGLATSNDGISFERVGDSPVFGPHNSYDKWATEDPRITEIDGDFYITYVAVANRILENGRPPRSQAIIETSTALLKTKDFKSFEELGIISPPGSDNKDIVLFPKKINGRYAMLHRPSRWVKNNTEFILEDGATIPNAPSIWISFSDDLRIWTNHHLFFTATEPRDAKIGPSLPPIETEDGWLIIYHQVTEGTSPHDLIYSARVALFDLQDPTKLVAKLPYDILIPEESYEKEDSLSASLPPSGYTKSVVFPTGGFIKEDELFVYYGASDKYIGLATGSMKELLIELRNNRIV
jgi:predicted GH43/DUF377 family glycosyl hydrolase